MEEYKTVIDMRDFEIYEDYKEQNYKLWFEGFLFYDSPKDLVMDFIEIRHEAREMLDECEVNSSQLFNPDMLTTGKLSIEELKSPDGRIFYYLNDAESFKSGSVYSIYQRFSDELSRLAMPLLVMALRDEV